MGAGGPTCTYTTAAGSGEANEKASATIMVLTRLLIIWSTSSTARCRRKTLYPFVSDPMQAAAKATYADSVSAGLMKPIAEESVRRVPTNVSADADGDESLIQSTCAFEAISVS
jgi:hypothetical protein